MRRKSERNKTKSSPEKKPEKPTRKSTRRRTKKSPSTSPERGDNSNDGIDNNKNDNKEQTPFKRQTRLRSRESTPTKIIPSTTQTPTTATTTTTAIATTTTSGLMSPVIEETDTKVTSTEPTTPKKQDEVDESGGSVWKVARADASPGQIQKLKICRQRNLSETSDVSLSKKRSSKWQDYSDGVAESADSADEPPTTSNDGIKINNDTTIDNTTSITGRDSGEEVSDRKEIPSDDITTVNMSDVKKNIDKQQQQQQQQRDDGDKDDHDDGDEGQGQKPAKENEDNNDDVSESTTTIPTPATTTATTAAVVDDDDDASSKEDIKANVQKNDNDDDKEPEKPNEDKDESTKQETTQDNYNDKKESTIDDTVKSSTESDDKIIEEKSIVNEEIKKDSVPIVEDEKKINEDKIKEKKVSPSSSDNDEDNKKQTESSDNKTNDESKNEITTSTRPVRLTRRKHRDKYRDSSNSETGDSDDEPRRRNRKTSEADNKKVKIEKEKNEDLKINKNIEIKNIEKEQQKDIKNEKTDNIKREKSESPDEHLDIHADTENDKEKLSDAEENNDCKKKTTNDNSDEIKNQQIDDVKSETIEKIQTIIKPAKVCLKRTYSRASVDVKKDDADSLNDPSQDKENHVSESPKVIPKRRRWGTSVLGTDTTPVLSISTDSLQALVPGAKPLSMSEVRLTKDDDEVREHRREQEKHHEINNGDEDKEEHELVKNDSSKDNQLARRKISIVKDTSQLPSPSSPSGAQVTNVLFIKNLVRPFTMTQLKELLSRTGTIIENGFWMDRIKSKAYVEYTNEDQAFETRQALHGISWPISNPKKLVVEYATKEAMNEAKELFKDQPAAKKVETVSTSDNWPNSWDDKTNTTTKVTVVREWDLGKEDDQHNLKDKEREKKDNDSKKRKQRSRSPLNDSHLPAPARKFKKKEDDAPPAKLLDDLFKKTKATPCIYWLPLTNEQIVVKEEMRRKAMAENARRLEEFRRGGNRDNNRRHGRSPRK